MTTQLVAKGWDYVEQPIKCGNTTVDGDTALCRKCEKLNDGRPWYICKHGNDVSEFMCGDCEGESLR